MPPSPPSRASGSRADRLQECAAGPGTYALFLVFPRVRRILVGRAQRRFAFAAGLHVYTGSALGSGGLAARLRRHFGSSPHRHWHIDYVTQQAERVGALVRVSPHRLECAWARWFAHRAAACMEGFGASDCACPGHLFRMPEKPRLAELLEEAAADLGGRVIRPRDAAP